MERSTTAEEKTVKVNNIGDEGALHPERKRLPASKAELLTSDCESKAYSFAEITKFRITDPYEEHTVFSSSGNGSSSFESLSPRSGLQVK